MTPVIIRKILFFTLFLFLANNNFSQYNWKVQRCLPVLTKINYLSSSNTIRISGGVGTITTSTDNGLSWTVEGVNKNAVLRSVFYSSDQVGWVCSDYGFLLRTTNGGENWTEVVEQQTLRDVVFFDDYNGITVGQGKIFTTSDQGQNWMTIYVPEYLNSVTYGNSLNVWAVGNGGRIYRSTNGGNNWSTQTSGTTNNLYNVFFLNSTTGFTSGNSVVLYTTNAGQAWTNITPAPFWSYNSVYFIDDMTGFTCREGGVYKTTNRGSSWNLYNFNTGFALISLRFINSSTGFVAGEYGWLFKTTNQGLTWENIQGGRNGTLYSVFFTSQTTGYASTQQGALFKTSNGGYNWMFMQLQAEDIVSINFINQNTGWLSSLYSGITTSILKTTNSGDNWTNISSSGTTFKKILFYDENNGIAAGGDGRIYRSTNGGSYWFYTFFFILGADLNNIHHNTNANITWVCGEQGQILKSINHGMSWESKSIFGGPNFFDVAFSDSMKGYAAGENGLYFTTNGGDNWSQYIMPTLNGLRTINFPTSNYGFVGGYGLLYYTSNGGLNWYNAYPAAAAEYLDIFFISPTIGWAVGSEGTVINTGLPLGIVPINNFIPINFSLYQNYPNPFNPVTKIKFDVPNISFVKIIVYDLIGREVTTLLNEELKPGTYEVDWGASNFASGMYFYSLVSKDYVETKKMVLIK